MLIDSHIHLDAAEFAPDRAAVIETARAAGVRGFVVPAVDRASFDAVLALAAARADVCPALGIHPLYVMQAQEGDLDRLEELLAARVACAVGEIGLDHFVADVDRERQLRFFTAQLGLARRHGLPVILHVRRAIDPILRELRRTRVCGGIAHAFNGSRQQAESFIALGLRLGFGGAMSYEGSTRIRELARSLPLESIVLETDAPDIPPAWARGERNLPQNLARYARILAELRGIEPEEVIEATGRNLVETLGGWQPR